MLKHVMRSKQKATRHLEISVIDQPAIFGKQASAVLTVAGGVGVPRNRGRLVMERMQIVEQK